MKINGFQDTISWYDNNSKQYSDSLHETIPTDSINWFLSFLKESPKILEVGCGPGRESTVFVEKGVDTIGVDISSGLLSIAKEKNPSVRYVEANFTELPFEEEFDGVWSHASLVHLETQDDVSKAILEFKRVLKPEGFLYIFVKKQTGDNETAVVRDKLSNHERFFRYYQKDSLKDLVQNIGFDVLEVRMRDDDHGREEVKWIELIARKK